MISIFENKSKIINSSNPLVTADVGINFRETADIMAKNKIKRLPLKKDGRLTTIVCACDLLNAFEKT